MLTKSQGFSLIELMIVIAIIGILLAIAVPAYNDYTIRAKLVEVLTLASAGKVPLMEEYASNGQFPVVQPIPGTVIGDWLQSIASSRYTGTVPVYTVAGTAGLLNNQAKVAITLSPTVGGDASSKVLEILFTATNKGLAMECSSIAAHNPAAGVASANTLDGRFLPSICR
jgi:prepilin-type N-terminal cleavage/methylation domain-containing protein